MSEIVEPIGVALVHFVWQGLAVALALALVLRFTPRSAADARYALGVAALGCMALLPLLTVAWVVATPDSALAPRIEVPDPRLAAPIDVSTDSVAFDGSGILAVGSLQGWVVALWLIGVLSFTLVQAGGWLRLRRLRDAAVPLADPRWQRWADGVSRRLGIRRRVALLRSGWLDVPVLLGWIRPVIIVPTSALTGICPHSLEALLLHELAHVQRHDFLVNSLQAVVETVLFYHPAVWWVSRQVRREREHCCDDLALSLCGSRRRYVQALADMETLRHAPPSLALAADGGSLVERIRRLTASPPPAREASPRWTVGLLVLGLVVGAGALQVAFSSRTMAGPAAKPPAAVVASLAPANTGSGTIEGTWKARSRRDEVWIELRTEDHRGQMSFSLSESDFRGLGNDGIPGFDLIRDAGTIAFAGSLRDGDRPQRFTFHPNPAYPERMQALGFRVSEQPRKLFELAALDVSFLFAEGIRDAGYGDISTSRLTEFRIHGVDGDFIGELADAGYDELDPSRLVEFRIHGVTPEFVRGMAESGFDDLTPSRLVEFRIHDVSPEFVREMADAGFEGLTASRLVEFRIHGVTPEFVHGMADSGFEGLTASRLVEFRIHGVTGEFVDEMTGLGIEGLTPGRLVEMRIHGVSVDFARRAQASRGNDLTAGDLVEMRIHGTRLD